MTAQELIEKVRGILWESPELNISNYDSSEVELLNNAVIEAIKEIDEFQSLADTHT